MWLRRLPLALTLARLPLAGLGFVAVGADRPGWVLAAALAAVATDVLDGFTARRLGVASEFGANLDSMVDFVFYGSVLAWTVWLTPEVLRPPVSVLLGGYSAAYVLLFLGGLVLARRVAVHNRLSRIAAAVGTAVALAFIAFGYLWWLLPPLLLVLSADVIQRAGVLGRHLEAGH